MASHQRKLSAALAAAATIIVVATTTIAPMRGFSAPAVPAVPPPPVTNVTYHNASLPRRSAENQNLLVLIHGFNSNPAAHFADLKAAITASGEAANWMIWEYDWREDAELTVFGLERDFLKAVDKTIAHGQNLAFQIAAKSRNQTDATKWGSVHLFSHSLGAPINEIAARQIAPFTNGNINQTFSDPSLGGNLNTLVGKKATLAENYYSPNSLPTTGKLVPAAFNVNLDAVNPYSTTAATHAWPTEWYKEGIAGTQRTPKSTYNKIGWGFSREKALADSKPWPPGQYTLDKGKNLKVDAQGDLIGATILEAVEGRQASLTPLKDGQGSERTEGVVALSRDANDSVVGFTMSADGSAGPAAAWLNLDTTNAGGIVNTMTFDYRFDGTIQSPRLGYFSILLADETASDWYRIYNSFQEFQLEDGLRSFEPVSLLRDLSPGEYAMHISFHSLDGVSTNIELSNIEFSYRAVVPEPSTCFLLALAAVALKLARRQRFSSQQA